MILSLDGKDRDRTVKLVDAGSSAPTAVVTGPP